MQDPESAAASAEGSLAASVAPPDLSLLGLPSYDAPIHSYGSSMVFSAYGTAPYSASAPAQLLERRQSSFRYLWLPSDANSQQSDSFCELHSRLTQCSPAGFCNSSSNSRRQVFEDEFCITFPNRLDSLLGMLIAKFVLRNCKVTNPAKQSGRNACMKLVLADQVC